MDLSQLAQLHGESLSLSKMSYVFSQGENSDSIYVVLQGVLKAFYISEDGKEYIKSFLFAGDTIASLKALRGNTCSFSLLCLEDCKLRKLPYKRVLESAATNIDTANSVIDLLMGFSMKKEQREYEFLCLSAEQRYQNLLKRTPNIHQQVTQNDIARYLGITPVALSRIKNQRR